MSAVEAPVGYEVDLPGHDASETVLEKCEDKTATGAWVCLSHQETFPHNLAMQSHTASGYHIIAWLCHKHGVETP